MKNKYHIIIYILLVIVAAVAFYFYWETRTLKEDFETYKIEQANDSSALLQQELQTIDSLLFAGQYTLAQQKYRERLQSNPNLLSDRLESRLRFLGQFTNYKKRALAARSDSSKEQTGEDFGKLIKPAAADTRKLDSMAFVIKKDRLKIKNLQKQITQKSAGEYLTFESGKGSKVHYVGAVKNGKANGRGLALLETGSRYEGQWKNNLRHGEGAFYWPDGEYYIGAYENDKRQGKGKYFWPNGEKYVGDWENDKRNGKGSFYNEEGQIITSGIWRNDELVESNEP